MLESPDPTSPEQSGLPTRRAVIAGVGAAGAAAVLAGCGTSSGGGTGGSGSQQSQAASGGPPTAPTDIGRTADVPVGGGKIFADQDVVVTQPTAGQFKAFSATCTHMGCTVGSVSNGVIQCPCHGSQYSITDGSVKTGPAPKPLPPVTVTVKDGSLVVG